MKTTIISIVAALCGIFSATAGGPPVPANDNFAASQAIFGDNGQLPNQTNVGATLEVGEPTTVASYPGGKSVWYSWTAPATGTFTFQIPGAPDTNFDTQLSIYTGSQVNALASVGESDPGGVGGEVVTFSATQNTIYRVRVTGYQSASGTFALRWSAPNPNGTLAFDTNSFVVNEIDGTATATVLRSGGTTGSVTVDFATSDGGGLFGEPDAIAGSDYTTSSGTLTFADGDDAKTITVPIINDLDFQNTEAFTVTLSNPTGGADLGANTVVVVGIESDDIPPGDNFEPGIVISGATGEIMGNDSIATSEGEYEDNRAPVLWYRWTAPITGVVRFSVIEGSGHFVDVFRGTTYGNKVLLNMAPLVPHNATVLVTAGTVYRIAVGGASADFTLSWVTSTSGLLSLAGTQDFIDPFFGDPSVRYVADEKGGNLTVKVRRTGGLEGAVSATVTVREDTDGDFAFIGATADADFTGSVGTVSFLAGEAEKTITVPILNDTEIEDTEDFVVALTNPTGGALLGQAFVQAHIFDDEGDPANDDFANATPIFGVSGTVQADTTQADLEVTEPPIVNGGLGATLWYRWSPPAGGVVEFFADPFGSPDSWIVDVFTAGATGLTKIASRYGGFDINGDPFTVRGTFNAEVGQTYYVRLDSNQTFGGGGFTELTWTTVTGGLISFGPQNFSVTEAAGAVYPVVVSREGGLASGASVRLRSMDFGAIAGEDYTPVDVTVVFNPGESTKTVNIPILNDGDIEGDEQIQLELREASGGVLRDVTPGDILFASLTIFDDEDDPANDNFISRVALGASGDQAGTTQGAGSEAGEPDHGRFSVWYGWTSPAGAARVASFNLNFTSGMANPTVTVYTGTSVGGLTQVTQGFDQASFLTTPNTAYIIAITDRGGDDGSGGIFFSPSGFTLTYGSTAGGSIIGFESATVSVAETAGTLVVNVTRTGSTTDAATVDFDFLDVSTFAGDDYAYVPGTLTFDPGQTAQTITIPITNDSFIEGDELFQVSIFNPTGTGVVLGSTTSQTVTILDDDDDIVPPDNDNFANAIVLTGENPIVSGFTAGATTEMDEPTVRGELPNQSVWYSWTAPGNGSARLSLNSETHTTSAYTGATLANLSEVTFLASNSFAATSGTTYFVPVNASAGSDFELTINFTAAGLLSFDAATLAVREDNGPAAITIQRSNGTTGAVSVRFRAVALTATAGSDFTAVDTVVNFASGVATQTVNVPILDDALSESPETVRLFLEEVTGGALSAYGPDEVVALVIQDDESAVSNDNLADALAISGPFGTTFGVNTGATAQAGEPDHVGNSNGNSIWFRWTALGGGVVTFTTTGSANGTALAAYSGTAVNALTPLDGESDTGAGSIISFSAVAGQSYFIAVDSIAGGAQGSIALAWSIVAPGRFDFSPTSYSANETDGSVVLTVVRSGGSDGTATVGFATSNGTALAGQDYTTATGTLVFADGETSKTITVTVLNDSAVETSENFSVTLSSPTGGATIGTATASVTILSEDTPSEFSFSPTSYSVSEASANVVLTVVRTGGGIGTASVDFATVNGSAVAGQDFTAAMGTLSFANGETSKTITVTVTNDTVFELAENFTVTLSNPSDSGSLGSATATVSLMSNDAFTPGAVSYAALVNPGGVHAESGLLTLTQSATGGITGKLLLGGKPLPIKGSFDAFGKAVVTIAPKGGTPVSVEIQITDGGKAITGRVYNAAFDSAFTGDASFYSKTRLYPQPGPFTLALLPTSTAADIPQGIGTATMKVASNGTFTIKVGMLADATALKAKGFIAENGRVQFYALLYKGAGSIAGIVNFRNETTTDADGTLMWFKPGNLPGQKFFTDGFDTDLTLNASFYTKPAAGTRIDTAFDANTGDTVIDLAGGNLAAPLQFLGKLDTANKFTATTPVPLRLTGKSADGTFGGDFTPASGKTKFKGVFLQKSNQALGQFFGATASGSVTVVPD